MTQGWAVVVGGAGDIGGVIVDRLLKEGLKVVVVGRSAETLAAFAQSRPGVVPCAADVASDSCIEAIAAAIGGPVRIAVHSPGVTVAGGVQSVSTAALVSAVDIKVGGMLRLVRAVESRLEKGSRLVGIGGHYGFEPTAYAATAGVANAALANLVRQLNWAYGEQGITAHLVAPGPVDTERLHRVAEHRAHLRGVTVETVLDEMRGESALKAFTTAEQVAWGVAMLLAPEADALAGASLMLDSGRRRGLP